MNHAGRLRRNPLRESAPVQFGIRQDIYRAAMRLIEQHGEAAELAAVLRADPVIQADEETRQAVIDAIAEFRDLAARSSSN